MYFLYTLMNWKTPCLRTIAQQILPERTVRTSLLRILPVLDFCVL